jgi:hypothetical protein
MDLGLWQLLQPLGDGLEASAGTHSIKSLGPVIRPLPRLQSIHPIEQSAHLGLASEELQA